jgi:hypothetical protein
MNLKNRLISVLAALMMGASGILAAVFPRVTAEELTAQSQVILEGEIVRSWAAWDPEHKYIWTHYEVSVTERLRGSAGGTFTISEPGGGLDGVNQQFNGAVSYSTGENAILFLYQTPIGYWRSVGGPQGKFTVDSQGRVHNSSQANTFIETPGGAAGTSLAALEGISLRDFKTRVQRLAAAYPFRGQR